MKREDVERLSADCLLAAKCLGDTHSFETGQGVLRDASEALRALLDRAERAEAERDAAFAAGQEEMRERAVKAVEMAFHTGAGGNDLLAAHNGGVIMAQNHIRALPVGRGDHE